jgi:uncharacterized coiled-coil protein SlyX
MSRFFKHYLGPTALGIAWDPVWGEMHREAAYIDQLISNDVETSDDIQRLQRRAATQSRQIEELSAALAVLMRMLGEAKQLDLEILDHRVDAELELRRAPAEQPPGICTHCGKQRPGERLSNSPYGLVCTPKCE